MVQEICLRTHLPDLQLRTLNIAPRKRPGSLERGLSIFVLLILGGIGVTVFGLQFRHNPANDSLLVQGTSALDPSPDRVSQEIGFPAPESLVPAGPAEFFSPENLSNKINGKA